MPVTAEDIEAWIAENGEIPEDSNRLYANRNGQIRLSG